MNVDVLLLGKNKIDIETFLAAAKKILDRNISQSLDKTRKDIDNTAGYLTLLAGMRDQNVQQSKILEDPGYLLEHVFYSFLVVCDQETLNDIREQTKLSVSCSPGNRNLFLVILSGSLDLWRSAIINSCSDIASFNLRYLFDKILLLFEYEGLSKIWSKYSKKNLSDKTFKLIERK
jgi:hypothetical protein